jgi:hypothetical protein
LVSLLKMNMQIVSSHNTVHKQWPLSPFCKSGDNVGVLRMHNFRQITTAANVLFSRLIDMVNLLFEVWWKFPQGSCMSYYLSYLSYISSAADTEYP